MNKLKIKVICLIYIKNVDISNDKYVKNIPPKVSGFYKIIFI